MVRSGKIIHGTFLQAGWQWSIPCCDLVGWGPLTTPRGALGDCPNHLKLRCWGHPGPLVPGRHLHRLQRIFVKADSPQRPVGIWGGEHTPRDHGSQLRAPHCKPEREAAAQRAGPFPSTQQVRSHPDTIAEQVACRLKREENLFFSFFSFFSCFFFFFSLLVLPFFLPPFFNYQFFFSFVLVFLFFFSSFCSFCFFFFHLFSFCCYFSGWSCYCFGYCFSPLFCYFCLFYTVLFLLSDHCLSCFCGGVFVFWC